MSSHLLQQIIQFLQELEPTQDDLLSLFGERRGAVTAARTADMLRLAQRESELTQQMQQHLDRRQQILTNAGQNGLPDDSLSDLVTVIGGNRQQFLNERIERSRGKSEAIRRESWIHWIITQRAFNHYTELLDLIAHRGKKSPTYSRERDLESNGGAIIDASV